MPPVRANPKHKNAEASSSKQGQKRKAHHQQPKANAITGRQKLKGALRQARRLLAKSGLAANVRVETERRVKALEAELEQAEVANKERDLAVRYHKVKFFERQKVVRKLNQTKKALQSAEGPEKEQLEADLMAHRVDLNYVLHYPKTKKYISLFPPEVRSGASSASAPDKTSQEREEIQTWIRECMMKKELPAEPELQLDADARHDKKPKASQNFQSQNQKPKTKDVSSKPADDINEDEFFGNDDDSSEESDNSAD
ncbi:hypothetical protein EST38_g255 [Candolleomyces aberdarensis]|uniref:rRNA-processing protein EFG1 n=1 Tax=Candolleomyces aberdarensis TaxID=2316362 RepID=A0A4Q2DYT9_9AGAR|nr:hypothetical protein EST38_g255 [Candolleomyces aberdarensis]